MRLTITTLATLALTTIAFGDDWPQWMGPKRDNIWRETGILEKFPAGGPKKLWSFPVAGGYSGPAVANGKVVVTDYLTKDKVEEGNWDFKETTGLERVYCVDMKTGKQVWKHEYQVTYKISYPAGPRCTPVFDGEYVYTIGAEGHLFCFNVADGKIVWQKELKKEYNAKTAIWGYAAHPLIDGKKLITVAGRDGNHIVALDKATGKELWKSQSADEQGYVPPSIIEFGGVRQLLVVGPKAVRALNPETGERYWSEAYTADNGSVIMTPILKDDYLFFGGWNNKNLLIKLDKTKPAASTEWKDKKGLGIHAVNVQPFLDNGIMYGIDQSGMFYACELPSGKRIWESNELFGGDKAPDSGTAFITKNGDRFFFFTEKGDLVIGTLSKDGFKEIDRAKGIIEATNIAFGRKVVWCAPAFANKQMFVRNDKELCCFDLAK